ncbi:hypothetical protein LY90DRAFT_511438 [Neocallimastix californiae]|uniref:Uncharacterized protein n=1 Tax=Neocallimastix californiae TaxID=1754190 RepID=A0A1Y2BPX2_9FUNG|nr:hypothetical protein LY90DRAFT_511438 [Neocallimastix californiae]|eukprot:ORY36782.1 hypothetical protein LY90DRAFT_511438 [Neocallimastix californiae]
MKNLFDIYIAFSNKKKNNNIISSIPLEILPTENNEYECTFTLSNYFNAYFENEPPSLAQTCWNEGILNCFLHIKREKLEWCFDFRNTNMLLNTLIFEKDGLAKYLFFTNSSSVEEVEWYIHCGLTEKVIKCFDLESSPKDKLYIEIENNLSKSNDFKNTDHDNNQKEDKNKNYVYLNNEIHFKGIPVKNYSNSEDLSYIWQKLPSELKVNLSNSINNQTGFVLKAVLKGHLSNEIPNDKVWLLNPEYNSHEIQLHLKME